MVSFDDVRTALADRFRVVTAALSADGREVLLTGPVDVGLEVGGFAVVELDDERRLAVQVRSARIVEREGADVDVDVNEPGLPVRSVRGRAMVRTLAGSASVLGVFGDGRFAATPEVAPFPERHVRPATAAETATLAAALTGTLDVGTLLHTPAVAARLHPAGFARHTFMCGQSGSGKTYTTGAVLERLLAATTLPIVVLDPNSDHVHLGRLRDPEDESPVAQRHRRAAAGVRVVRARGTGADHLLCLDLSDLPLVAQALLLHLDPVHDLDEYSALRRVTAALDAPYSVADVRSAAAADPETGRLATRIDNLGIASWDLWRRGEERSAAELDVSAGRCFVIDLGSLNTPGERAAVSLGLLGRVWMLRRRRLPMLLVVDEAHNILPSVTADPLLSSTADLGVLIAGEGRKFGLHLFVATQRPGKVHPNVVSQCDNLLLMRMNGSTDIEELSHLFSHVPPAMLHRATTFGLGQALFAGPIAPTPLLARVGTRVSPEGGADVPTDWAHAAADTDVLTYPHEGPESS